MISTSELFLDALDDYFDSVEGWSWADLEHRQEGLTASLAFGAAGLAYAHAEAGLHLRDEALLDRADAWVRAAEAHEDDPHAFLGHGAEPGAKMPPGAFLFGPLGLHWTAARIAEIRRDRSWHDAAGRFAATARHALDGESLDLYRGVAGALAATAGLLAQRRDPRLVDLASALFRRLERAARMDSGMLTWSGLSRSGLAHGATGAHLALLLGAEALDRTPPPELASSLVRHVRQAVDDPASLARPEHRGWLCTGFPGLSYAAARLHRSFGGDALWDAARDSAEIALAHPPLRPDLCCGRLGVAYACLALAAEDPSGPWRRRATEHALSTLLCEPDTWPVVGLYGGEAAFAAFVLDLLFGSDDAETRPAPVGLPGFEPGGLVATPLRATA